MKHLAANSKLSKSSALGVILLGSVLTTLIGCGQSKAPQSQSNLEFIQSRPDTTRYAYLEPEDMQDVFLFGASVIKTEGFTAAALNMALPPIKVRLKPQGALASSRKLDVVAEAGTLMSFAMKKVGQQFEVDFASAGNDLTLRSIINDVGGTSTSGSPDGYWRSSGAPKVVKISQDADTMVVDLLHTIQQVRTETNAAGQTTVAEIISPTPGKVVVRIYLKRQKSSPAVGTSNRTVALGKSKNIGFFGPTLSGGDDSAPIQRHNLGDTAQPANHVTYYLKNVPELYLATTKKAVLSWNKAFGADLISVGIATEEMDVGDPRYHVIKWFDGTDNSLGWAGVAKMIVDPDTGMVLSGSLYIQGDNLTDVYADVVEFSNRISPGPRTVVTGQLANVSFTNDVGEQPVAPFLSDLTKTFDEYMQGYYLETIAHEVGHTLGLRHNFRASTAAVDGESGSVMDYAPRAERDNYSGPGFYDVAAIKWAYFGTAPTRTLPFCTDENLWESYTCNQGDWGDPIQNTIDGLADSIKLLSSRAVPVTRKELISSVTTSIENAFKIKKFIAKVPAAIRAETLSTIEDLLAEVLTATPAQSLNTADRAVVAENLAKLKALAVKTKEDLQARDLIPSDE